MNEKPIEINANRNNSLLTILWDDRHQSDYPFMLLRAACPCASCRGGHENMRTEPDQEVFYIELEDSSAIHLNNIQAAGSYGVIFEWEDGHHFGIYTWHYLRALCPCAECRNPAKL